MTVMTWNGLHDGIYCIFVPELARPGWQRPLGLNDKSEVVILPAGSPKATKFEFVLQADRKYYAIYIDREPVNVSDSTIIKGTPGPDPYGWQVKLSLSGLKSTFCISEGAGDKNLRWNLSAVLNNSPVVLSNTATFFILAKKPDSPKLVHEYLNHEERLIPNASEGEGLSRSQLGADLSNVHDHDELLLSDDAMVPEIDSEVWSQQSIDDTSDNQANWDAIDSEYYLRKSRRQARKRRRRRLRKRKARQRSSLFILDWRKTWDETIVLDGQEEERRSEEGWEEDEQA